MTRQKVLNSIPLKIRFIKDCGLPIAIYENPYFYERVIALDVLYDSVEKFDRYCYELSLYDDEQEYFKAYQFIKDSAIDCIKDSGSFNDFINETFDIESQHSERDLYVDENDDTAFISIDMKKANFSALSHYSSGIFKNCNTWEDFMRQFTDNEHIIYSKYIRKVILGACNPENQIQYERYLMTILCNWIVRNIPNINIYSLNDDEIIVKTSNKSGFGCGFSLSQLKQYINSCPDGIGELVRVDAFELFKIKGTKGWRKSYVGETEREVDFKCLDIDIVHQVIKYFYGEPISKDDLVFTHNGKLARFLKPISNPFK